MKKPTVLSVAGLGVGITSLFLWGCPNPNSIGVQQYGSVGATCVQASNGRPVSGALVTVSGVTPQQSTNSSGYLLVPNVPIATNLPIQCNAPGLTGSATVPSVTVGQTTNVTISMSPG